MKRTKELSATSTEKVLEATEQAREKAKPYTEKAMETAKEASEQAKQAAERASEAAKPYYDKSKEAAQKAYDDAAPHRQGADGQTQAGRAEEELSRGLGVDPSGPTPLLQVAGSARSNARCAIVSDCRARHAALATAMPARLTLRHDIRPAPPCRPSRPRHRGHPRHRPRRRPGLRPGGRAPHPGRPHRRRAGGGRRRDPRRRRQRHAADPRPQVARQDRRARPHHLPALEQARHPRRQRRHPGAAVAAGPRHGGRLERGAGDQPHRQLAADPHARPAAAPLGRRPRHLRLLGRGDRRRAPTGAPTPPPRRGWRRW